MFWLYKQSSSKIDWYINKNIDTGIWEKTVTSRTYYLLTFFMNKCCQLSAFCSWILRTLIKASWICKTTKTICFVVRNRKQSLKNNLKQDPSESFFFYWHFYLRNNAANWVQMQRCFPTAVRGICHERIANNNRHPVSLSRQAL